MVGDAAPRATSSTSARTSETRPLDPHEETHRACHVDRPLANGRVLLNRSKQPMLLHYAHRNGYRVRPRRDSPVGFLVERVRIDGLFDDQRNSDHPDHTSPGPGSESDVSE